MRSIVNISLPEQLALVVNREVKVGKYASKSEFFRSVLREWMKHRFYQETKESMAELKKGKGKVLNSLKDLR